MPGFFSNLVVARLCQIEGFQTQGFWREVRREAFYAEPGISGPGFVPDAWKIIDRDTLNTYPKVIVAEVEDTNLLTEDKAERMAHFWDNLDYENWGFEVWIYDRYGKLTHILGEQYWRDAHWNFLLKDHVALSAPTVALAPGKWKRKRQLVPGKLYGARRQSA